MQLGLFAAWPVALRFAKLALSFAVCQPVCHSNLFRQITALRLFGHAVSDCSYRIGLLRLLGRILEELQKNFEDLQDPSI